MPVLEKILKAKQTPGLYVCKRIGAMLFIEVDEKGNVYQLSPSRLTRDGILSDDGWNESPHTQAMQVFRLEQI